MPTFNDTMIFTWSAILEAAKASKISSEMLLELQGVTEGAVKLADVLGHHLSWFALQGWYKMPLAVRVAWFDRLAEGGVE